MTDGQQTLHKEGMEYRNDHRHVVPFAPLEAGAPLQQAIQETFLPKASLTFIAKVKSNCKTSMTYILVHLPENITSHTIHNVTQLQGAQGWCLGADLCWPPNLEQFLALPHLTCARPSKVTLGCVHNMWNVILDA